MKESRKCCIVCRSVVHVGNIIGKYSILSSQFNACRYVSGIAFIRYSHNQNSFKISLLIKYTRRTGKYFPALMFMQNFTVDILSCGRQ
jgi:hypothetical protein